MRLFDAIRFGGFEIWPPLVLAPMAGISNAPFRSLCRSFGAGLCISEMISARALVEGHEKTRRLAAFGPEEFPRSLQLYGTDPRYTGRAVQLTVSEGLADHIDLNFGCPVRKVKRQGGGAAMPARPELLRKIVRAAVQNAGNIPVTIKFRKGLDNESLYFRETGHIAQEEGCAAVSLHGRTAAQMYRGRADWESIGELKSILKIPVIGNGDILSAADAVEMMRKTDCDAVAIGRGCLGRPWLFREVKATFSGEPIPPKPDFGEILDIMLIHARQQVAWFGEETGVVSFRKHGAWYIRGYHGSAAIRRRLMEIQKLDQLEKLVAETRIMHEGKA